MCLHGVHLATTYLLGCPKWVMSPHINSAPSSITPHTSISAFYAYLDQLEGEAFMEDPVDLGTPWEVFCADLCAKPFNVAIKVHPKLLDHPDTCIKRHKNNISFRSSTPKINLKFRTAWVWNMKETDKSFSQTRNADTTSESHTSPYLLLKIQIHLQNHTPLGICC